MSPPPQNEPSGVLTERTWTWVLIGVGLLITILSLVWLGPSPTTHEQPAGPAMTTPQAVTPEMVALVTGDEPLPQLFKQAGCPVCHTIPGIDAAEGRVGPKLALGTTGAARLADPEYRGHAKTVREYIVESILNPGLYIVPGYPPLAMPRWYGQKLSAAAVERIAEYLEQQRDESRQ